MAQTNYLLDLLHVVDSSFPTGSFVHSAGLESLRPKSPSELEALLRQRLRATVARVDLVFLQAAYVELASASRTGSNSSLADGAARLTALDARLDAMLLPRESRQASSQVGAQLLRNACDLFEVPLLPTFLNVQTPHHLAVTFGAVAAALVIPPAVAAEAYAFQQVRGLVAAAQRLIRLGQRDAQRILHALKTDVRQACETASTRTVNQAGAFAPLWDIAAMAHERAAVRLFVS